MRDVRGLGKRGLRGPAWDLSGERPTFTLDDPVTLRGLLPTAAGPSLPDLRIDDVEIEGDDIGNGQEYGPNFRAGDTVSFRWDVDNIGNASAGSSRVMVRLINDIYTVFASDTNPTSSISAGGSDTNETASFVIPATLNPGLYGVQIIADDQHRVTESNEGNNEFLILIRIDPLAKPDLVIDDAEFNGAIIHSGDEFIVRAGDEITLTWDVDNRGDGDADDCRVGIFLRDEGQLFQLLDWEHIEEIEAGESSNNETDTFTFPSGFAPGLYGIVIRADYEDDVDEDDEDNNDFLFLIRVEGTTPSAADDFRDEDDDTSSPLGTLTASDPTEDGFIGLADANDTRGDKDVFRVTLTQGQTYQFTMTGATVNGFSPLSQSIFTIRSESNFNSIIATSTEGSTAQMEFHAQSGGTYYIRTGSGGANYTTAQGGYRLTMGPATNPPGQVDPDGTINISSFIESTDAYSGSGSVGAADPVDVFKLTAPSDGRLIIDLTGLTANIDLGVFNESGGLLGLSNQPGTTPEHVSIAVTAGETISIRVTPYTSAQGAYNIHVDLDRAVPPPATTLPSSSTLIGDHLLRTLAEFAAAAYSDGDASTAYSHLVSDGWRFYDSTSSTGTILSGLGIVQGRYSSGNSSVLLARASDALVISFRGTDTWADWLDYLFMTNHYDRFYQFINGINELIGLDHAIRHVFVTGHSLGAAMVDLFMEDHANITRGSGGSVQFEAITFAHPDVVDIGNSQFISFDGRITSFHNREDFINWFDYPTGRIPGLRNIIEYSGNAGPAHNKQLYVYGTDFLARSGVGDYLLELGLNGPGKNHFLIPAPGGIDNTLVSTTGARLMVGGAGNDHYDVRPHPVFAGDTVIESGGAADWLHLRSDDGGLFQGTARVALGGNGVDLYVYPVVTIAGISQSLNPIRIYNHFSAQGRVEFIQWAGYFTELPSTSDRIDGWNGNHYKRISLADIQYTEAADGSITGSISATGGSGSLDTVSFGGLRNSVTASLIDGVASILDGLFPPNLAPEGAASTAAAATAIPVDISNMENVSGSSVDDDITGSNIANYLEGGGGNDHLVGLDGNDMLDGGDGMDRINGGVGADTMIGGAGDDLYVVDNLLDQVIEAAGGGRDTVFATASYTLTADGEIEILATTDYYGASAMNLSGNSFGQEVWGNAGINILDGSGGADWLFGGDGTDTLFGGDGEDYLYGDGGGDRLTGGAGADRFMFEAASDSRTGARRSDGAKFIPDVILDFTPGEDKIDLSGVDAVAGDILSRFTFIGTSAFSHQAGQLRYEPANGFISVFADVDGDGLSDMTIIVAGSVIQATDFIL